MKNPNDLDETKFGPWNKLPLEVTTMTFLSRTIISITSIMKEE
jgi:hypothetical protein